MQQPSINIFDLCFIEQKMLNSRSQVGGRRHWTVNFTSFQSLRKIFSCIGLKTLGTFILQNSSLETLLFKQPKPKSQLKYQWSAAGKP